MVETTIAESQANASIPGRSVVVTDKYRAWLSPFQVAKSDGPGRRFAGC